MNREGEKNFVREAVPKLRFLEQVQSFTHAEEV
jgi:hypothetical protein